MNEHSIAYSFTRIHLGHGFKLVTWYRKPSGKYFTGFPRPTNCQVGNNKVYDLKLKTEYMVLGHRVLSNLIRTVPLQVYT
jgi:hypothetical protein